MLCFKCTLTFVSIQFMHVKCESIMMAPQTRCMQRCCGFNNVAKKISHWKKVLWNFIRKFIFGEIEMILLFKWTLFQREREKKRILGRIHSIDIVFIHESNDIIFLKLIIYRYRWLVFHNTECQHADHIHILYTKPHLNFIYWINSFLFIHSPKFNEAVQHKYLHSFVLTGKLASFTRNFYLFRLHSTRTHRHLVNFNISNIQVMVMVEKHGLELSM